jgi:hypothetical protein
MPIQLMGTRHNPWRRAAAAATLSCALCAALLFSALAGPASATATARHATATPQLTALPHGKSIDKTCQRRGGGVVTCEWLYTWVRRTILGPKTAVEAWASMSGNRISKQIVRIQTYARRCLYKSCSTWLATQTGSGYINTGNGYIQGHDFALNCGISYDNFFRPSFKYKYWLPKPVSSWITGTAVGAWQLHISPC